MRVNVEHESNVNTMQLTPEGYFNIYVQAQKKNNQGNIAVASMLADVFKISKDKVKFEKGFGFKKEKVLSLKGERI